MIPVLLWFLMQLINYPITPEDMEMLKNHRIIYMHFHDIFRAIEMKLQH